MTEVVNLPIMRTAISELIKEFKTSEPATYRALVDSLAETNPEINLS